MIGEERGGDMAGGKDSSNGDHEDLIARRRHVPRVYAFRTRHRREIGERREKDGGRDRD